MTSNGFDLLNFFVYNDTDDIYVFPHETWQNARTVIIRFFHRRNKVPRSAGTAKYSSPSARNATAYSTIRARKTRESATVAKQ